MNFFEEEEEDPEEEKKVVSSKKRKRRSAKSGKSEKNKNRSLRFVLTVSDPIFVMSKQSPLKDLMCSRAQRRYLLKVRKKKKTQRMRF